MQILIRHFREPKRSARKFKQKLIKWYYIWKNNRDFLRSGEAAIEGDLPYDKNKVEKEFLKYGITPKTYMVDNKKYGDYINRARYPRTYSYSYGDSFVEKTLEHFLSFNFSTLDNNSVVIDIANAGSPFPEIIHNIVGCKVFSNDLKFSKGVIELTDWHTQIGGSACHLPVPQNSFDLMVLHCALEMFEGNDDIDLIKEASRVLREGGKIVIVPLYMNETYHILRDPKNPRKDLPAIDEGAKLIYQKNFHGVAFARFYSVKALYERLVKNAISMEFAVYKVVNAKEIDEKCYISWIGVFEKRLNLK